MWVFAIHLFIPPSESDVQAKHFSFLKCSVVVLLFPYYCVNACEYVLC